MTDQIYPTIRLLPKVSAKQIRFGAPWAYADQLVFDRRTRAIAPGSIVLIEDANRVPLGIGAFNGSSKIAFRMMDADPEAVIDGDWLKRKIARAFSLREQLFDTPFYRLIHAEADGLPGLIIDRFGDVAVMQPNAAWAETHLQLIIAALAEASGIATIYKNASGRSRKLEGLDEVSQFVLGEMSGQIDVPMNGAIYKADILEGQKTGIFLDQRDNQAFAARLAKGGSVLDMFSHVGGFALAALANGASSALAVDSSQSALDLAEAGAKSSGVENFTTRKGDAFRVMEVLIEEGQIFNMVVCDPPAFAPAKQALEAGLRAYDRVARLASALVAPGGYMLLCSCSHAADLGKFRDASLRGIGKAGRKAQILHVGTAGPDHPTHAHLAETSYLKALFLRLD